MTATEKIKTDALGPAKVLQLYDPQSGLQAILVVDNVTLGPAIGGVRISPTVSPLEVFRLARAMTLKNASAGLNHGGGKAGIIADPHKVDLEKTFRTFGRMIAEITDYIPGPDMGCDEQAMVWLQEEIGRAVGLPAELGGLPLDVLGATGFGVACCAEVAAAEINMSLSGARVAIQGFGNVGLAAARFLAEKGAVIVAVNDSRGTRYDAKGMNIDKLIAVKKKQGSVIEYDGGKKMRREDILGLECDILVPAANPDVINMMNFDNIKARLILQGANIPITAEAETELHRRGVLIIPDFIANAGGVIMAAMEYQRKNESEAFAYIKEKIQDNTVQMLERMNSDNLLPRTAAEELAKRRLKTAMSYRSWSHKWG
ncbi:glutamate dehydrogenase (NAD(P)+) [Malonomonas rubra DSM 5091]|uniref:Glutamate dehydrogenase n=1 Tax=Malonomonas rubra DSM 5091 TaxID=1122189 RepID=A0A1M6G5G4_MALRU|nr:Glu/Leu/Phe/Val dehydrogenase [Malonomonas rubra]SHJ05248.1 glutamate dehydrogenase (NAD(P)+) [Malonomonas rubra DSM 5091]